MEGRLLIKNCTVLVAGELRQQQAVIVEGSVISGIHDDSHVPVLPGDWEVAAQQRLLTPGRSRHSTRLHDLLVTAPGADAAPVARWLCAQHLLSGFTSVSEKLPVGMTATQFSHTANALGLQLLNGADTEPTSLELAVGQPAELILIDAVVPNVSLLKALTAEAAVSWVITAGVVRVRERQLLSVDAHALAQQCAAALRTR